MKNEAGHPRYEKLEPGLKQRIFDAAVKEFGSFGYRSASMNRLVEGAGISKGALFKYFGTKSGLFGYVYSSTLDEVKAVLREVQESTRDDPFFTRLEKVIVSGLEFTSRRPLSAAVYYRVIYTGDAPHSNRILAEIQGTSRRFLKTLIEEGMVSGELRQELDADRTAFILQSVLDRFLQAHYLEFMAPALEIGPDPSSGVRTGEETWIGEIVSIFKYGLTKE